MTPIDCRNIAVLLLNIVVLSACTDSSNQIDASNPDTEVSEQQGMINAVPQGDLRQVGVVTVSDEDGAITDLVGGFFRLDPGISTSYLHDHLQPASTKCTVNDANQITFNDLSVGFAPGFPGVSSENVSAGDVVTVSSTAGSYADMIRQQAGGIIFYDVAQLPAVDVPSMLTVDIPGDALFDSFSNQALPMVETLAGVSQSASEPFTVDTQLSWTPAANSFISVSTQDQGGFFLDDNRRIQCVTPDTGSFQLPQDIKALLGPEFTGSPPVISRLNSHVVFEGSSALALIRESIQ